MKHSTPGVPRILLVEDNPGEALLTREALRAARIANTLEWVQDGDEAMDFLHRSGKFAAAAEPDLILLDLDMPRMNGHDVLAGLKGDPALRHIPVVVLSASREKQDVLRAYALHANCFVRKSVDFGEFARAVESIGSFWFRIVLLPGAP